jgi:hypothetical protein
LLEARSRRTLALVSIAGLATCVVVFVRFFRAWAQGRLDWWPGLHGRDVYLAAGHGYGKGFVVGFFAAFFLVLLSLAVSSWWEARRGRRGDRRRASVRFTGIEPEVRAGRVP